jgi:YebC/PmpR family DNA-binding regulatory protein
MSGHSHWATIKHKKALVDAKRGKHWSKLAKAIIVAAKHGGGDPDQNLRLRYAIDDAKANGVPKDNIQRAIKSGTGDLAGDNLEEVIYEGSASGVAVVCEILTNNRNRTAPEIRKVFELSGGKLGTTGCVAWMFDNKGLFLVPGGRRRRRAACGRQVRGDLRSDELPRGGRGSGKGRRDDRKQQDHADR